MKTAACISSSKGSDSQIPSSAPSGTCSSMYEVILPNYPPYKGDENKN